MLAQYSEGVICLSGCGSSEVPRLLLDGQTDKARSALAWYRDVFGPERFYVELQWHDNIPGLDKCNAQLIRLRQGVRAQDRGDQRRPLYQRRRLERAGRAAVHRHRQPGEPAQPDADDGSLVLFKIGRGDGRAVWRGSARIARHAAGDCRDVQRQPRPEGLSPARCFPCRKAIRPNHSCASCARTDCASATARERTTPRSASDWIMSCPSSTRWGSTTISSSCGT